MSEILTQEMIKNFGSPTYGKVCLLPVYQANHSTAITASTASPPIIIWRSCYGEGEVSGVLHEQDELPHHTTGGSKKTIKEGKIKTRTAINFQQTYRSQFHQNVLL